ncbi:MAG TPA: PrgI family protein [Clostridia bacterium]|nr:PrgI family protein [Clostridia bacterium]
MEVKLLKEIRNYSESILFGLSMRQFLFAALAVGCSVAVYFIFHNIMSTEAVGWLCILSALPGAFLGFFKYQGLNAEDFLRTTMRYLFSATKLPRVNTNLYFDILTKGRIIP